MNIFRLIVLTTGAILLSSYASAEISDSETELPSYEPPLITTTLDASVAQNTGEDHTKILTASSETTDEVTPPSTATNRSERNISKSIRERGRKVQAVYKSAKRNLNNAITGRNVGRSNAHVKDWYFQASFIAINIMLILYLAFFTKPRRI